MDGRWSTKSVVKVCGYTEILHRILSNYRTVEMGGLRGVVMICVNGENTSGEDGC